MSINTTSAESTQPALTPLVATYTSTQTHALFFKDHATRQLQKMDNGHWRYQLNLSSLFVDIVESIEFDWKDRRIIPLIYRYDRTGMSVKNRHALLRFDWKKKVVTNQVQDSEWKMVITDNTLDKLSYQLQLRFDLMQNKTDMSYLIADGGRLKQFIFKVDGTETIETALGKVTAVRVKVVKKTGWHKNAILWFAKEWGFLLAKMEQQNRNGTINQIKISSATINGQRIAPSSNGDTSLFDE